MSTTIVQPLAVAVDARAGSPAREEFETVWATLPAQWRAGPAMGADVVAVDGSHQRWPQAVLELADAAVRGVVVRRPRQVPSGVPELVATQAATAGLHVLLDRRSAPDARALATAGVPRFSEVFSVLERSPEDGDGKDDLEEAVAAQVHALERTSGYRVRANGPGVWTPGAFSATVELAGRPAVLLLSHSRAATARTEVVLHHADGEVHHRIDEVVLSASSVVHVGPAGRLELPPTYQTVTRSVWQRLHELLTTGAAPNVGELAEFSRQSDVVRVLVPR